jgi:flagellar FliJ protein
MSALPTLIRLARHHMEEKRRKLVGLETLMSNLNASLRRLDREVEKEQSAARHDEHSIFFYGAYAQAVIARRENIQRSIDDLQGQLDEAHGEVAEAYQEVRRYEVVHERQREREMAEEARRDQAALDDMAIEMFRRRGSGENGARPVLDPK